MNYCKKINKDADPQNNLDKDLEQASPEIETLIKNMLKFNPNERWTAKKCVSYKLFDKLRQPDFLCENITKLDFSAFDSPDMFDYDNNTNHTLLSSDARKLIDTEIQNFHAYKNK